VIFVAVSRAGDHDVKVGSIECGRLRAAPPRAVPVRALLARSMAVAMWPRLAGMSFARPSPDAVAAHDPMVAE